MKCKKCIWLNKKSTITIDHNMMSCLVLHHDHDYYDVDGNHHHHGNPCNQNNDIAECSNGHRWSIRNISKCWCGWASDEGEEEVWLKDKPKLGKDQVFMGGQVVDVIRMETMGNWTTMFPLNLQRQLIWRYPINGLKILLEKIENGSR